jgi:hypothetical protein
VIGDRAFAGERNRHGFDRLIVIERRQNELMQRSDTIGVGRTIRMGV